MGKKIFFVVWVVLLMFVTAACTQEAKPNDPEDQGQDNEIVPATYNMVTGSTGGTWYLLMGALGELMENNVPGATAMVEPGGAFGNVILVNDNDSQFGLSFTSTTYEGWEGIGDYDKDYKNVRSMVSTMPFYYQFIALEKANIKRIEDLRGKSYTPAWPGQTSYITAQQILEVCGLTFDDTKLRPQGWEEAHNAMKDLQLDALSWWTSVPQPSFIDLDMAHDINIFGFEDDSAVDQFLREYPMYCKEIIPAESYPFQEEDVITLGTYCELIVNKDVPEEVVYRLIKAIYENKEELLAVHQSLEFLSVENSMRTLTVPLHPGAARYYQEIGADIPQQLAPID